jgi:hypothetical protein
VRSHRVFSTSPKGNQASPLIVAFLERTGGLSASAWHIIRDRVSALEQQVSQDGLDDILTTCARLRNIHVIEEEEGLNSDGFIEPLGSSNADGFRVVLRKGVPNARRRFTLAHEICHTFFYEAVPELKFSAGQENRFEEALCNYGAGCLLISETALRETALALRPCLASLETLSELFKVSQETMMVRLRDLGLWRCDYSLWHKMTNGGFVIERLYAWDRIDWNWSDSDVLERAWCSGRLHRGETLLWWETTGGCSTGKVVHYELKRRGDGLIALWDERNLYEQRPPLLPVKRPQRKVSHEKRGCVANAGDPGKRYWWTD